MNCAPMDEKGRSELERAYRQLNDTFNGPVVFHFSYRGFYSEVNALLNAVIFALVHRRRLLVNQDALRPLRWEELYRSRLPAVADEINIDQDWIAHDHRAPAFKAIRDFALNAWRTQQSLVIPELGFSGNLFQARGFFSRLLCAPQDSREHVVAPLEPFAAIHVRRGDKTAGYQTGDGRLIVEGEATPVDVYFDIIDKAPVNIRDIFLMTDDYAVVREIQERFAFRYAISTLSSELEDGYTNKGFRRKSPSEKRDALRRLILETSIAERAALFIGGTKSNVPRFIAPILQSGRYVGVDSLGDWRAD